jgi:hypothetical protein
MLPTTIELEQAAERQERAVSELLEMPRATSRIDLARRAIGRWFMALGARIAADPSPEISRLRRA